MIESDASGEGGREGGRLEVRWRVEMRGMQSHRVIMYGYKHMNSMFTNYEGICKPCL